MTGSLYLITRRGMAFSCAICMLVMFSAPLMAAEAFVNLLGYHPAGQKFVYADQPADSFQILDRFSNQVVFRGAMSLQKAADPNSGVDIYRGDFSSLQATGSYIAIVVGVAPTYPFDIGGDLYNAAAKAALKGYYFQRSGIALQSTYAAPYQRTAGHVSDGTYHPATGNSGFLENSGGWYDAGDYGKYIVNAGISAATLLMAYERFPDRFAADDLNIPESGNGIPDLLDELRFELQWMLKMQAASGGVYHKLTRETFSGYIMPSADSGTRYIYPVSSTATADFAAVLARASRIYQSIDTAFAQICLNAAQAAWNYLSANPGIVPPGGFSNPPGTVTGVYGDSDDRDERLWAAAELYSTTGETVYHNYFLANYSVRGVFSADMNWQYVQPLAQLTYLYHSGTGGDPAVLNTLRNAMISFAQNLKQTADNRGFGLSMSPGDFYWGSSSLILNRAILLITAFEETQDDSYRMAAWNQLHYLLGANPHRLSFVTGVGFRGPQNPHHRPSIADNVAAPIPGLLAGGANEYLNDPILQANFDSNTPPAECYIDHVDSYASNEIAINWNAPLVLVLGYFAGEPGVTGVEPRATSIPAGIELYQNYPNPFNGETVLRYRLAAEQLHAIEIWNLAGQRINRIEQGQLPAGEYRKSWDGKDGKGRSVGSGVFFFRISGSKANSPVRKMMIIH